MNFFLTIILIEVGDLFKSIFYFILNLIDNFFKI